MTKYHIKWQLNPLTTPEDPEKRAKLWISMLEMVKADLKSGRFIDWGSNFDVSGGYAVAEGTEVDINASILKWIPYVIFDIKPVLSVDQMIGATNKAVAESKVR
ncbi:MAG: hypothetical protein LUQ22_05155 [Methanotrichaceae archaeon]|nr:hypothetical protein [Methanotrichaceae archaeon]